MPDRVEVTLIVPEWHTWTVRERYRREVSDATYRVVSRALHRFASLDVLWFPWNGCSWTKFSLPAVATLHDATAFMPDRGPQDQVIFRAAVEHCEKIITDSNFSRDELMRVLPISPNRIVAIPLGVWPVFTEDTPEIDVGPLVPFVLFVGTSERRKGLDTLVHAMEKVQTRHPELRLVIAGERGDGIAERETVRITELGFVADSTLRALYRNASVFAYPSRYEGFGLPTLEAMKWGVPVVTTSNTAIPEAAGDAADYVPVDDADALADAIIRIVEDPAHANGMRERGLRRAASMTWAKAASATLDVLESVRR
jgi:alpha-1,3-rhamnosyl/mannosyltransferase